FGDGSAALYLHQRRVDDAYMNNIGDSESMFDWYLFIVNNRPQAFRDVLTSVAEAEGGVLFHCFAGKDRTGLVAAMLLSLAGVPAEHIAADYGDTDNHLARPLEVWI